MISRMLYVTIFVLLVVWFLLPRVARIMIHTPTAISIFVCLSMVQLIFFFQAEDCIRYLYVTGVQTCALPILFREVDPPRARLVGEAARPDDRVRHPAELKVAVRAALGPQVDAEAVALRLGIRAARADHDVVADGLGLGRFDELYGPAVVHRLLAFGPAARAGAGGEDHRVAAAYGGAEVLGGFVLDVEHLWLGSET